MNTDVHHKLVSFIWSIADDCLRDVYVRGKYRDVILPMVVLRRLDALLEPTKDAVMEEVAFQRDEAKFTEWDEIGMRQASGYVFYNTSPWTLQRLHDTVDLSTYGLERVKLNTNIGLDSSETELEPQNPNPRGAHDPKPEADPLNLIIPAFNERWFQGWNATPEEQRVKFVQLAQGIRLHPDFKEKYSENKDSQNREIAFRKIFDEVMAKQRKNELELYRLVAKDDAFKLAMQETLKRILMAS